MKALLVTLTGLFLIQTLVAQMSDGNRIAISAKDARKYIGEEAVVTGTIAEVFVSRQSTNVYLYLDADIENAKFAAVWPGTNNPPVGDLKELIFKGKPISVSGRIVAEKGVPEIYVRSWTQIK